MRVNTRKYLSIFISSAFFFVALLLMKGFNVQFIFNNFLFIILFYAVLVIDVVVGVVSFIFLLIDLSAKEEQTVESMDKVYSYVVAVVASEAGVLISIIPVGILLLLLWVGVGNALEFFDLNSSILYRSEDLIFGLTFSLLFSFVLSPFFGVRRARRYFSVGAGKRKAYLNSFFSGIKTTAILCLLITTFFVLSGNY